MIKIKVLVCEVHKKPYVKEIEPTLKEMQSIVGGLIEQIYYSDDVVLICNDEGKINNLPWNRPIYCNGQVVDIIAGNFFVCTAPRDCEEYSGLNDEQISFYSTLFKWCVKLQ